MLGGIKTYLKYSNLISNTEGGKKNGLSVTLKLLQGNGKQEKKSPKYQKHQAMQRTGLW